jgi:hypothetical protein
MRKTIVAIALAASATTSGAYDRQFNLKMYGVRSCDQYVSGYGQSQERNFMRFWLAGYITAANYQTPDTYDVLANSSIEDALLWMLAYCKANPRKDTFDGLQEMLAELSSSSRAQKAPTPPGR